MVTDVQASYVMALIKERHSTVRQAFDGLLHAFATGDQNEIIAKNESFRTALHQLKAVVATEHWPNWLKDLSLNADRYATNHANGMGTWIAHLKSVISHNNSLISEGWDFEGVPEVLFDFDGIVAKARSDNKINELFDKLIETLESVLDSEQIDSVKATSDLKKLVSNLKTSNQGSFFSQLMTWNFARVLIPNIISTYAKENKLFGPLLKAVEETAKELDVSLTQAKTQISDGIKEAAASSMRSGAVAAIERDSSLFLEYRSK